MSKRQKEAGGAQSAHGSNSARVSLLEQKLLELQIYTDDALSRKEGSQRSTRAFSDALLNVEMRLMRQREAELVQRVAELERGQAPGQQAEEIRRLNAENEDLRAQCGDKTNQLRALQLEAKDRVIQNLTRALAEAKKETQLALKSNDELAAEVLLLHRQLQAGAGASAGAGAAAGAGDDVDSFFASVTKAK